MNRIYKLVLTKLGPYNKYNILAFIPLGFCAGLPLPLIGATMSARLMDSGLSLTSIGLFALAGTPYALKFLWSPLIDTIKIPFLNNLLGKRRSWLLITQIILFLIFFIIATINPLEDLYLLAVLVCSAAFISATQDIALDAYKRNVIFDVGHVAGSFSFPVAEACLEQNIVPGTISSDIHKYNARGPVFDLLTTLSKYLYLGLSLNDVISKASYIPAEAINMDSNIGTIQIGSDADIAIVEHLKDGKFNFHDAEDNVRLGEELLVPEITLIKGEKFNPKHKIHEKLIS